MKKLIIGLLVAGLLLAGGMAFAFDASEQCVLTVTVPGIYTISIPATAAVEIPQTGYENAYEFSSDVALHNDTDVTLAIAIDNSSLDSQTCGFQLATSSWDISTMGTPSREVSAGDHTGWLYFQLSLGGTLSPGTFVRTATVTMTAL